MYSTRAFAELTGVTVKALRHYERMGLLGPMRLARGIDATPSPISNR